MSSIDSMTMSAPAPGLELVVAKPTNRLERKVPNDDHYRNRFPSRVSTKFFMPTSSATSAEAKLRIVICVRNPTWAAKARQSLESAEFLG
jgi:hypothetical protein